MILTLGFWRDFKSFWCDLKIWTENVLEFTDPTAVNQRITSTRLLTITPYQETQTLTSLWLRISATYCQCHWEFSHIFVLQFLYTKDLFHYVFTADYFDKTNPELNIQPERRPRDAVVFWLLVPALILTSDAFCGVGTSPTWLHLPPLGILPSHDQTQGTADAGILSKKHIVLEELNGSGRISGGVR